MKTHSFLFFFVISIAFANCSTAQDNKEPWTEEQLMPPSELAKIINNNTTDNLYLFSVFYGGIKNSIVLDPASEKKGIENLKNRLSKLPKDANIVIYCGCCPFKHCPNIRPAFNLLNQMNFTNHKLLNLPNNLKTDWIDKGYPINE